MDLFPLRVNRGKDHVFIVSLPLGRDHLKNDEIVSDQTQKLQSEVFIEKELVPEEIISF